MKKKLLSLLLAFTLAFSVSVPAFAANYSDLNGHWSESYMEDLAGRGYLSGYGDGTMRPDKAITTCETLALLSRFYAPGNDALELIKADYEQIVKNTVSTSLSWAYDEIEVCLAAGIITENELKNLKLTEAVEKEQLSVFLVRAMQLESAAQALADAELTFDDADDISKICRGYVAELASLGIVTGDDDNNFCPNLSVTRAVVAAMVSRSLDHIEKSGSKLVIDAYDGVTRTEGLVTGVSSESVEICGYDGLTRIYTMTASSSATVNGVAKVLTSAYIGSFATVTAKDGTITTLDVKSSSSEKWVQGAVYSFFTSTTLHYVYVKDLADGSTTKYVLSNNAVVTRDGASIDLSSIVREDFVTLKIVNDAVTTVNAVSSEHEISGSVSAITYGSTVNLRIADADGTEYSIGVDVSAPPAIYRGKTTITIDRLNVGDKIVVTIKNGAVTSIVTEGSEDSVTGELTSIISTVNGTQWVITADDGSTKTLKIDSNVGVYNGSTSILLSDIQAGDTVTVVEYGGTATEIYLESSSNSTTKVSGTVLAVDTKKKVITLLVDSNKMVYVDTTSVVSIITASTGKYLTMSNVAIDSKLVAYGTYSDSATFNAKSIIIEG